MIIYMLTINSNVMIVVNDVFTSRTYNIVGTKVLPRLQHLLLKYWGNVKIIRIIFAIEKSLHRKVLVNVKLRLSHQI